MYSLFLSTTHGGLLKIGSWIHKCCESFVWYADSRILLVHAHRIYFSDPCWHCRDTMVSASNAKQFWCKSSCISKKSRLIYAIDTFCLRDINLVLNSILVFLAWTSIDPVPPSRANIALSASYGMWPTYSAWSWWGFRKCNVCMTVSIAREVIVVPATVFEVTIQVIGSHPVSGLRTEMKCLRNTRVNGKVTCTSVTSYYGQRTLRTWNTYNWNAIHHLAECEMLDKPNYYLCLSIRPSMGCINKTTSCCSFLLWR